MIKFKSDKIIPFRTDKAHLFQLSRKEPIWIPASVCICKEHSKKQGVFGYKRTWECEIEDRYINKYPKLIPMLIEKELIWDVEEDPNKNK